MTDTGDCLSYYVNCNFCNTYQSKNGLLLLVTAVALPFCSTNLRTQCNKPVFESKLSLECTFKSLEVALDRFSVGFNEAL